MRADFSAAHAVLQAELDAPRLAGVCTAVLHRGELVDRHVAGFADRERGEPMREDHLHRAFSNTKLVTAVAVLQLVDEGRVALDDPIHRWIPGFGSTRVLRPGWTVLDDTVPLARAITVRHLLGHGAGLSHGVFDPGTAIYAAYHASGVRGRDHTMAMIADKLPALPLLFQPGEGWEYSMAPDVLARLVEIVDDRPFADSLRRRIFEPLGMADTGYLLRPDQRPRLAALYGGNLADPAAPGLERRDELPWPRAHLDPVPRQGGASGLVTTLGDMLALLRALRPGGGLLRPATLAEMGRDQLSPERCVQFPDSGRIPSLGFSLVGAVTRGPSALQPNTPAGELQWGGLAGTHWALHPASDTVLVLMTQRHFGFWNPFWWAWKRAVYAALGF